MERTWKRSGGKFRQPDAESETQVERSATFTHLLRGTEDGLAGLKPALREMRAHLTDRGIYPA